MWISQDVLQITNVEIDKDILDYFRDICLRYHLDIQGYLRICIDIFERYWMGYLMDNLRISILDIMWMSQDITRILYGYLIQRCEKVFRDIYTG